LRRHLSLAVPTPSAASHRRRSPPHLPVSHAHDPLRRGHRPTGRFFAAPPL